MRRVGSADAWVGIAAAVLLAAIIGPASASYPVAGDADPAADGLIASPEPGWPQWRGPRRDGHSTETDLLPRWPEGGPKLVWKIDGLGTGWSSPIVVAGRIYITGDVDGQLVLFAFDRDGKPIWRTTSGASWDGPYPGARAACTFSEGNLYHLNAHGRLVCLEAATGEELWSTNILQRFAAKNITWALSECVLVDGPRVLVTPGGREALIAALDKTTGKTVWATPPPSDDPTSHSSPILLRLGGRRVIANSSAAHGFGVDADTGRLLWTVPQKNRFGTNVSTPVYGDGRIYYVTPYAELGRQYRLRADAEGIAAEHVWTCPLETVTGGSVLVGDVLYSSFYRNPKSWLAVDWRTGATKHELTEFTSGAAIWADGRLYVLDESGAVGLIEPAADGLDVVGRFRLFERRERDAWTHPVLCDGRLYLRYHDTLWCYDVSR
jgi:outer membrane protein assembly factor BamB